MPFDLADLRAKRRLVNVAFDGATLEIHYSPARFDGPTISLLTAYGAEFQATGSPDLAKGAAIAETVITDWNATDDGEPVPVTAEEFSLFEGMLQIAVLNEIAADYWSSKNGNSSSSTSKPTGRSAKRRNGTAT